MHRPILIFLLFLVLFATNIDPLPQNYDPVRFDSTRVTIRSEINDPLPLRVHCRSKTEDLGAQALDYGEVFFNLYHKNIYFKIYDFSFRANQDTCYWCKLYRWKKENGDSALYKTLINAWGSRDCGDAPSSSNQFWSIREDGAYTDNVLKKSWLRPEDANDF